MSSNDVVIPARGSHTATVIFLHGLGDTGHGWAQTISELLPPHVKLICPTAKAIPVTLNAGFVMPAWFDLIGIGPDGEEDKPGIAAASNRINSLIDEEKTKHGIERSRVVLGGFSQGGALSLHVGLRSNPNPLAGVIGLSCWLPSHRDYPAAIGSGVKVGTRFFQGHGVSDPLVIFKWGQMVSEALKNWVDHYEFRSYAGLQHSSCPEELTDVKGFIGKCLPSA